MTVLPAVCSVKRKPSINLFRSLPYGGKVLMEEMVIGVDEMHVTFIVLSKCMNVQHRPVSCIQQRIVLSNCL